MRIAFTIRGKYAYVADGAGGWDCGYWIFLKERIQRDRQLPVAWPGKGGGFTERPGIRGRWGERAPSGGYRQPHTASIAGALELGGNASHLALNGPMPMWRTAFKALQTVDISDHKSPG